MDIRFATTSYKHDASPISAQRVVNAFAEAQPPDAKSQVAVFGSPGISTFATAATGPIRGLYGMNGVGYAVAGSTMISFNSAGTITTLGGGITGTAPVPIEGNGTQVMTVDGQFGFVWDTFTNLFTQVNDPSFNSANTIAFIDNYFAFDWAGTRKFFTSKLLDGLNYNALAFATKESKPDRVMAVRNRQNALLVLGELEIETHTNVGTTPFAFARFDGGTVNRGLRASLAIAEEDNALFFLGDDLIFYRLDGVRPMRISTHALERAWAAYTTTSDAFCFTFSDRGHKFIHLTFPTQQATWCYDVATQLWHERVTYDQNGSELRWRINCALPMFGKILVGDGSTAKIGYLDPTVVTEFGSTIITTLVAPPVHGGGKRVFMDRLEIDMEAGIGATTGQGSDPQVMLDWSDDGGRTFVSPQRWTSFGALGNYATRVQWNALGSFYNRTLRISISDPVHRTIIAARADVRLGL